MTKTKLSMAVGLAIVAAGANAQSSVTLFGVADLGILSARASGVAGVNSVITDGNTSTRFGLRGTEDLGGGLKAQFWIEGAVSMDTGASGTTSVDNIASSANGLFARRSTLGLQGNFGEVRMGRDYTPTFNNLTTAVHPFGTNGVGNAGQLFYPVAAGGTTPRTHVRASNSIAYLTPNLGGFSAHVMWANAGAAAAAGTDNGRYVGARLAYRAKDFTVSAATGKTEYATGDYTQSNIGATYRMGPARLSYLWGQNKVGVTSTKANITRITHLPGSGIDVTGTIRRFHISARELRFAPPDPSRPRPSGNVNCEFCPLWELALVKEGQSIRRTTAKFVRQSSGFASSSANCHRPQTAIAGSVRLDAVA